MEPVTFLAGQSSLEGVFHRPHAAPPYPAVVVCHPHPLYGGDMDNSVVVSLSNRLVEAGIAALRFNFRGTGRSEGLYGGGIDEREDVRGALDFLEGMAEVDGLRLGLAGYSFGALVALSTSDSRCRGVGAVSPPFSMFGPYQGSFAAPSLLVFGEEDDVAPASGVSAVEALFSCGYEVRVIAGADHFWWGKEREAANAVADYFSRLFKQ